jgi:hypothetical protein
MRDAPGEVPRPVVLQAALRKTTETLARELARPTDAAPHWSEFEWRVGRAVSAIHGVSPLLATTLRWRGPSGWMRFLENQRAHTAERHLRIEELLRAIDRRARDEGIAVVALKGAALHAAGLYGPGERPMADVDLLVRSPDSAGMTGILQSLAFYESRERSRREREFSPLDQHTPCELGEHSNNDIKIELHERVGEPLPMHDTDISELIFPAQPSPGLNAYRSTASLMMHLLLHAAGAMAVKALRLVQLHDLALLSLRMTDSDWDELLAYKATDRGNWWAFPPLQLTSRYYCSHIPSRILAALSCDCPALLNRISRKRRLSDVSLSYLWVDAFPGIEWSQSIAEMLGYAASRIRPSGEVVRQRAQAAQTEEPWASQGKWDHLPQNRRILRWVMSRPTRTRTMHSVRVALAQAQ